MFFEANKGSGLNSYTIISKMIYDLWLLWIWITFGAFDAGGFGFNLQLGLILIFLF